MAEQTNTMQRVEYKYILTREQLKYLQENLVGYMKVDKYGLTTICSLYFDTPDYRLIRTSIEKPKFKEKIRLRSYGLATDESPVYLEIKRKVNGVVYKRRIRTTVKQALNFISNDNIDSDNQIAKELTFFRNYYANLRPSCIILYDRAAYIDPNGVVRLTIDGNPRYRFDNLDLTSSLDGTPLLSSGVAILEIKIQGAMPLWLSHILDKGEIRKGSFSKYGEAYKQKALLALQGVHK